MVYYLVFKPDRINMKRFTNISTNIRVMLSTMCVRVYKQGSKVETSVSSLLK